MNNELHGVVRLLHVSDVHFGCRDEGGQQAGVLEAIAKAIEDEVGKLDAVVFTGDLAQAGKHSEFQQGQDWLVTLCELLKAPCVLVPGNHDVQRGAAVTRTLRSAHASQDQFGMWRDEIYKTHPHLSAFLEWFRQAKSEFSLFRNNWDKNPAIDVVDLEVRAGICRFVCLNTALLSCDNEDESKLCVDINALNGALKGRVADTSFVLALGHHPGSFLAPWNNVEFQKILGQSSGPHAYLHGHLHDLQHGASYSSSGAGHFRAAAGSAYPGSKYPKQFSILELDANAKEVRSLVFVFNEDGGDWVRDNKLSHPVPARLPAPQSLRKTAATQRATADQTASNWKNPFSDLIANGIAPESVHRLFVEQSDSLTKVKNAQHTIVEGQRGTGKTMLLRYFSFEVQSSLISQESVDKPLIQVMNEHQTPFGVYCCLTNAGLNRSDFDAVDSEARRVALFSHVSYLFIANRLFSALYALAEQDPASVAGVDQVLRIYTAQLLRLPTEYASFDTSVFFRSVVDATDLSLSMANEHIASLLPGCQPSAYNPWLSVSASLFGLLERFHKQLDLRSPFFILIDDFDQLNAEQQSIFFNAASARRHDVVCFKFGIMSEGQKAFVSAPGRTFREGDDYNYVRLDWVDGGVDAENTSSSYVKTVEAISERRMKLVSWPSTANLSSLFETWEHGNKLRDEARESARQEYAELQSRSKPQTFENFWAKQGNAKYFRLLASKKIAHRYAGKATIIDLSSGIFRQFLEICSGVVDIALADGWRPDTGKRIGPEKQNRAIREWSKDMYRSLGSSGDVSTLSRNGHVITSDHLIRLATSLSRYFQARLLSDSRDPEVIAISVRESLITGSFVKCLLDVAVRESVLQRRSVDYSSKSGGGERLPTFILNRRLVPHVGIGSKLQGRHELDIRQIELAATDTDEFLRQMLKPGSDSQGVLI
jgi:predicted phosphodiesterase